MKGICYIVVWKIFIGIHTCHSCSHFACFCTFAGDIQNVAIRVIISVAITRTIFRGRLVIFIHFVAIVINLAHSSIISHNTEIIKMTYNVILIAKLISVLHFFLLQANSKPCRTWFLMRIIQHLFQNYDTSIILFEKLFGSNLY